MRVDRLAPRPNARAKANRKRGRVPTAMVLREVTAFNLDGVQPARSAYELKFCWIAVDQAFGHDDQVV
jgi:hypothetical protein